MSDYITPGIEPLREMCAMLFGSETRVRAQESTAQVTKSEYAAVYLNDENELVALCVFDIDFVAFCGAALTTIPKGAVDDVIDGEEPSNMMLQNTREIANIFSSLFMNDGSAHLRLGALVPVEQLDDNQLSRARQFESNAAFTIVIAEYGQAVASFWH